MRLFLAAIFRERELCEVHARIRLSKNFWRGAPRFRRSRFLGTPAPEGRTPGEGDISSEGIMFLMYKFGRLVALVYIRQLAQRTTGQSEGRASAMGRTSVATGSIKAGAP
jgi:hypothetical protein